MEPSFHAGDLGLVRPADHYRVGEIVAYHSTLLHVVVLHRIIAIHGDHYVFKGDNNNFVDPTRPTRSALVGALWVHVPDGGVCSALCTRRSWRPCSAGSSALLLVGTGETKRRRNRRGNRGNGSARQGASPVTSSDRGAPLGVSVRSLLIVVATLAVACALVAAYAERVRRPGTSPSGCTTPRRGASPTTRPRPPDRCTPTGRSTPGTPSSSSSSTGSASGSPTASRSTRLRVCRAPSRCSSSSTGPTGWTRQIALSPRPSFHRDRDQHPGRDRPARGPGAPESGPEAPRESRPWGPASRSS